MTILMLTLFGAIIGSYLATILMRWPLGTSAAKGRSRCDACGKSLEVYDLVPIFSFLARRGRAGCCGASISIDHLGVEIGAASIGLLSALALPGMPLLYLTTAVFGWALLLLAAFDLRHFWLPDRLTIPLAFLGLFANFNGVGPGLTDALIGAAAGFLSLWSVGFAFKKLRGIEGLGGGDPKIFAAIGAWLGWAALPLVLSAAAGLGLLIVAVFALAGRPLSRSDPLPLGALLAVAAWPIYLISQAV
jgi:leader peptidase (prepilin peptidase) / N-methyltransferase